MGDIEAGKKTQGQEIGVMDHGTRAMMKIGEGDIVLIGVEAQDKGIGKRVKEGVLCKINMGAIYVMAGQYL